MFETRKEFLQQVMKLAGLASLEEADRVAQVVIGLVKARIGPEVSQRVAEAVSPDLAKGWLSVALPGEVIEMQEMIFELKEVGEEAKKPKETTTPSYG
jgi:uncharacterized protein (DUF2267 family)